MLRLAECVETDSERSDCRIAVSTLVRREALDAPLNSEPNNLGKWDSKLSRSPTYGKRCKASSSRDCCVVQDSTQLQQFRCMNFEGKFGTNRSPLGGFSMDFTRCPSSNRPKRFTKFLFSNELLLACSIANLSRVSGKRD